MEEPPRLASHPKKLVDPPLRDLLRVVEGSGDEDAALRWYVGYLLDFYHRHDGSTPGETT